MTAIQSRLFAASLVCVTICGCATSGVGDPLPQGGLTKFVVYAPPGAILGLKINDVELSMLTFAPDSSLDNDPMRPAEIPSSYVAFSLEYILPAGLLTADLMKYNGSSFVFADNVDPFYANTTVLIHH